MIHQAHDIFGHLDTVMVLSFRLARLPVGAKIKCDDLVGLRQSGHDAWHLPIHLRAGIEPVNKDYRFTLARDDVMDLYAVGREFIGTEHGYTSTRQYGPSPERPP